MAEKKQRIISAILFIIIIFLMPVIFMCSDKDEFSETENRPLAKKPELTLAAIFDKSYMEDAGEYISDNFPGRMGFIKSKMFFDRLAGKEMINDIFLCDNMLIERLETPDHDEVSRSTIAINKFAEHYPNTKVFVMLAPTSAGIYRDKLPGGAPQLNQEEFIKETYSKLSGRVETIKIFDTMKAEKDNYIYYRTDHHWTSYGAYCAYRQAASALGFMPDDIEKYDIEQVSNDFQGTFYKKCFYDGVEKDTIDLYKRENGNNVTEIILNDGMKQTKADDIYFRDYLNGSDKYRVFLGENRACTTIRTDMLNKKKILVIKDSYANAFIPFLVNHYSEITIIDLRYVKTRNYIRDFVDPGDYSQTLFLYNASTFSTDNNVRAAGFFGQ